MKNIKSSIFAELKSKRTCLKRYIGCSHSVFSPIANCGDGAFFIIAPNINEIKKPTMKEYHCRFFIGVIF